MKNKTLNVRYLVSLAMLSAVLLAMSFTPLGYLTIGPLAISLNMIPVGIAAVVLGPVGGAIMGALFGITSFLQCLGIGGTSPMGALLFEISPVLAFVQRFAPRVLAGLLSGYAFILAKKLFNRTVAGFVTGFCAAILNTILFMTALVLLFGNTPYLQELINGRNVIVFICAFVGINAVVEMLAVTAGVGAVAKVLEKTGNIKRR
jgi:uncharacterized membrane protein